MQELDMRFGGIQRLYGFEAFQKIQHAHICVIGLGGVGSWVVESLARTGVGAITLVDFDDICVSNTNRQLHAMDGEIGKQKTSALKERILKINPDLKVNIVEQAYSRETEPQVFEHPYDVVVDAIDHQLTKYHLILACRERNIPIVLSGAAGGRQDPSQIKTGDLSKTREDVMMSALRKELRKKARFPRQGSMKLPCVFTTEKPQFFNSQGCLTSEKPADFNKPLDCATGFGTATPITGTFGLFLSHLAIQSVLNN